MMKTNIKQVMERVTYLMFRLNPGEDIDLNDYVNTIREQFRDKNKLINSLVFYRTVSKENMKNEADELNDYMQEMNDISVFDKFDLADDTLVYSTSMVVEIDDSNHFFGLISFLTPQFAAVMYDDNDENGVEKVINGIADALVTDAYAKIKEINEK